MEKGNTTPLAGMIDHTLLRPEATPEEIENACREARHYGFATVCVNPCFVSLCARLLAGTSVKVCTTIGFPLGASSTAVKAFEAQQAIGDGAREVEMVINLGMLKSGNNAYVEREILAVVEVARKGGALVKVILETGSLTVQEKVAACKIAQHAGADFLKTSTGFTEGGATLEDVALLRATVGPAMGVKASGGIRTREHALALIGAGANRIGTSASVALVGVAPSETGGSPP
jgi:deoxyribose-phosphate aldolase